MSIRIAINGFGRIGRDYLRASMHTEDVEVVAINDVTDTVSLARLLRHDSTFGPLDRDVEALDDTLIVDGRKIAVTAIREPAELPWRDHGVDIVIESTGKFRTREAAGAHLTAGARKVLISAPGKGVDATIVLGVNDCDLRPGQAPRHLQRLVHHQLPGAHGEGAAGLVRHRAWLHDHGARLHERPERARRAAQGPAPGPRRSGQHHPDHDRCGEGGGRGHPGDRGQARRCRAARAGGRRIAGGPRRPARP